MLTEDDQAALDSVLRRPQRPALSGGSPCVRGSHKTKNGKLGWYAARDAGYADIVDACFSALDGASPVFDKQEAWVNGLPEEDRNLLIEEYPSASGATEEDSVRWNFFWLCKPRLAHGSSSSSGSASSGKSGSRSWRVIVLPLIFLWRFQQPVFQPIQWFWRWRHRINRAAQRR